MSFILPWTAVFLLTALINTGSAQNASCQSYRNLTDDWRNIGYCTNSWIKNDQKLTEGWYRFTGAGGDSLVSTCPSISKNNSLVSNLSNSTSNTSGQISLYTCDFPVLNHTDCGDGVNIYYLHPINGTYSTRHSVCENQTCGPRAECGLVSGSCVCSQGYYLNFSPTNEFLGCSVPTLPSNCQTNLTAQCSTNFLETLNNLTEPISKEVLTEYLSMIVNLTNNVSLNAKDTNNLITYGNTVVNITERLVSFLVIPTDTYNQSDITVDNMDVAVFMVGPQNKLNAIPRLNTSTAFMDIDLIRISKYNNDSAAVAFIRYDYMGKIFKLNSSADEIMMSNVVSATLPKTNNKTLTKPVNFTFYHLEPKLNGMVFCVYWNMNNWVKDGCTVSQSNSNYTVCSCDHLSTFALIMQMQQSTEDPNLDKLNNVLVPVGLVFLGLAAITLAAAQPNKAITNTALINLCISLLLAHLFLLITQAYVKKIEMPGVCKAMAGIQHFLFLSAFVWMAVQAYLLLIFVRNLSKFKANQTEVLEGKYLMIIGYVIPLVMVGLSFGLFPDGYGGENCWLSTENDFQWSFLGPVAFILATNLLICSIILFRIRQAIRNLDKKVVQLKETRVLVFKALLQFLILGCAWILGFFMNGNIILEILFLVVNSQQGTVIFFVHCVFNPEIRQQYRRWLSIVFPSISAEAPKKPEHNMNEYLKKSKN